MMRHNIFEYFLLINEASYLFCDSLSYIFQQLNNSLEMLRLPQCSVSILLEFDLTILNFSFISAVANVIGEPGPFDGLIICCGGVKTIVQNLSQVTMTAAEATVKRYGERKFICLTKKE